MADDAAPTPLPVWLDGEIMEAPEARVSVFDHGITVGDGVFETIKAVDGEPFAPRRHLARLRRSAAGLGLDVPYDDDELRRGIEAVVGSGVPLARVRVTVTGGVAPLGSERGASGPTVVIAASPLAPPPPSTAVVVVPWRRNEHDPLVGLKTTSYAGNVVALARARASGASEALFANTAGALCEGTGSNVFVVVDGLLLTPPLSSGCLAGVTRDLLLRATSAEERDLPIGVLAEADEVLLTSTTRDVQAVHRIDERELSAPGPVTREAMAAFAAIAAGSNDP
jgi:branched-chain amino acid aminotransferase